MRLFSCEKLKKTRERERGERETREKGEKKEKERERRKRRERRRREGGRERQNEKRNKISQLLEIRNFRYYVFERISPELRLIVAGIIIDVSLCYTHTHQITLYIIYFKKVHLDYFVNRYINLMYVEMH